MKLPPVILAVWRWLPLPPLLRNAIKRRLGALLRSAYTQPISHLTGYHAPTIARNTPANQRDWVIFGIVDWAFRVQRPQHLARELAKVGSSVFFVEPHFTDALNAGYSITPVADADRLYVVRLNLAGSPQIYFKGISADQLHQLTGSMALLMHDWGIEAGYAMAEHAFWAPLIGVMPNTVSVYDCMDHHEGFGGVPDELVALEHHMLQNSDLVLVTSAWLQNWALGEGAQPEIVRNGCEYDYFATRPSVVYHPTKRNKVIGYFGAIAEWFDVQLVLAIAQAYPDCEVILVGADTVKAKSTLGHMDNVTFLGEQPYARLTHFLYSFNVCLLPFKRIPLTLATNPVKVYEYLCTGKHVVCVDLPEIAQFGELVFKEQSAEGFVKRVGDCLLAPPTADQIAARQIFACSQTWDKRAQQIMQRVNKTRWPSISVVVLTYNNWAYTAACLHSVLESTDYPGTLEVVVSDNGSSDETIASLQEWQARDSRLKLCLNGDNLGFSAGNNRGLRVATGDYLVMLNNDTVVTRGWLLTLLRHFQQTPSLGMLGPVTNHIGNEAKIDVTYSTLEDMPAVVRQYTLPRMGQRYPMRTLAFFCVMLPRLVMERVGLMDENFGRGFFEDDDYCRRIEQYGFTLACAEDVFVHHRLSASFDQVPDASRRALFDKNKAYYESKWGAWEPHRYRTESKATEKV